MDVATYREEGFLGPVGVMSPDEASEVLRRLDSATAPALNWSKGMAASRRLIYDIATRPAILGPVGDILGPDVVLWGASVVIAAPGHIHPPHVDIETSDPAARAVSVWIGLENASRETGLRFVTRSHRFGYPVQRAAADAGRRRGEYDESELLGWAMSRDASSHLVVPEVADGEAVWFDGQLWHGSRNDADRTRRALLLQYASADTPIRIPDLSNLEWPFRSLDAPRPPCVVVQGEADSSTNLIVPPPPPDDAAAPLLSAFARSIPTPLEGDASGWRPHFQFYAATSNLGLVECHVSTLDASVTPHPPHGHDEEEFHIVLSGAVEITHDDAVGRHVRRLKPGDITYYAAHRAHTLRGIGPGPAEYLVIKWHGPKTPVESVMDAAVYSSADVEPRGGEGFRSATLFEGPTRYLAQLHCHLSVLEPGAGFDAHHDAHDVAIVVLEGTLTSLGNKVESPGVLFTSGGYPHDLHNPGSSPARYLVFEFHGRAPVLPDKLAGDLPGAVTTIVPDDGSELAPRVPLWRRGRVAVWNWGGRVTRRFPRMQRVLRRALGALSPWARH